jgi:hypothetical protein
MKSFSGIKHSNSNDDKNRTDNKGIRLMLIDYSAD